MLASSARQYWPGNYQSCKRSYQSTLSSRRNKGKSYCQPYKIKETWTHEFCVVANKDQRKVPSTAYKQELREAGLGQKKKFCRRDLREHGSKQFFLTRV
jgi:hypothetical protein